MNNIPELIKTNPDAFDYPDCRPVGEVKDGFWEGFHKQVNDQLPDYLKAALAKAKGAKQQTA